MGQEHECSQSVLQEAMKRCQDYQSISEKRRKFVIGGRRHSSPRVHVIEPLCRLQMGGKVQQTIDMKREC